MKLAHLMFAGAAMAASTAIAATRHPDTWARLPAELVQGRVHYVSGGIGRDEARAFRQAERRYPLAMEFAIKAKPRDEFTAGVKVLIRDATGKTVLDAVSEGPFLLAKLPAGSYDIEATQDGRKLERHAVVAAGRSAHLGFLWRTG
jgi:hypothetical protein